MGNYNLFYSELAKGDLKEIALYINDELKNPSAAENLIVRIIKMAENCTQFPYSNPVYMPLKPLKREYRKAFVDNFMLFYWVDEDKKCIEISRVIYARRNLESHIKD